MSFFLPAFELRTLPFAVESNPDLRPLLLSSFIFRSFQFSTFQNHTLENNKFRFLSMKIDHKNLIIFFMIFHWSDFIFIIYWFYYNSILFHFFLYFQNQMEASNSRRFGIVCWSWQLCSLSACVCRSLWTNGRFAIVSVESIDDGRCWSSDVATIKHGIRWELLSTDPSKWNEWHAACKFVRSTTSTDADCTANAWHWLSTAQSTKHTVSTKIITATTAAQSRAYATAQCEPGRIQFAITITKSRVEGWNQA